MTIESSEVDVANREYARHILKFMILILIVLIAIAGLLYWFIWDEAPFMTRDSNDYMNVAVDLQDGQLDEAYFRAPGYPLLLLLTDSADEPSRLLYFVQLSLHLLSVLFIAILLIRLAVPRVYVMFFLVLSLLPPSVVLAVYVLTEALSEFLIVAGTVLLLFSLGKGRSTFKTVPLIISGLAFGFAAVVKPTYQLLFVLLSGIIFLILHFERVNRKKQLLSTLAFFAVPLLIIGGLYAYNYHKFNYIGLTPSFGFHFCTKTARVVERLPDEYAEVREVLVSNRDTILVERHGRHTGENYIWLARPELERITGLDKPGLSKYLTKMNLVLIKKAPLQYLKEVASAMTLYWFPLTTSVSNFDSRSLQLLWSFMHFMVIFVFFLIAVLFAGLVLLRWFLPDEARKKIFPKHENFEGLMPVFIIPLSIIIYAMLVSTMFEAGHQRYRTPTELLVFLLTVLGVRFLIDVRFAASKKNREL